MRHARFVLATGLLATALLVTGCAQRTAEKPSPAPAPSAEASAPIEPPVALADLSVTLEPLWRGLDRPLYLTSAADGSGRLYVVEQGGLIKVINDGKVEATPLLDVSKLISDGGERGLLGLAFSPGYGKDGRLYIDYTDIDGNTVVARYTTTKPWLLHPKFEAPEAILRVKQPYPNHNGGCLQFGPDGKLYVGMGDGGSAGDPGNRAQNPKVLLGKLLRIDVETSPTPAPEIVETGLRNPWRFSFDRKTGDLWIGDVGQDKWEEVDFAAASAIDGVNWGWHLWEGNHPYPASAKPSRKGLSFPIAEYGHDVGESVTGGYVYRGADYPAMYGTYLYGDYVTGFIAGVQRTAPDGSTLATPQVETLLKSTGTRPASFGQDDAGELYLVDYSGTIWAVNGAPK